MEDNFYVYVHVFPNGKHYVRITSQFPKHRWLSNGEGYKNQIVMHRAIQKYRWDNIEHVILGYDLPKDKAEERESHYIKLWNSNNPDFRYNRTERGNNPPQDKTSIEKRSKKLIGNKNASGRRTVEQRQRMSEAQKGNNSARGKRSEESKKRMSEAHKGKKPSEETKKKLSERTKAYWLRKKQKSEVL